MLNQTSETLLEPKISLTPVRIAEDDPLGVVCILTSQLITYDQKTGFTRLRLTGRKVLEVRETTDQIDRLVRGATSNWVRQ